MKIKNKIKLIKSLRNNTIDIDELLNDNKKHIHIIDYVKYNISEISKLNGANKLITNANIASNLVENNIHKHGVLITPIPPQIRYFGKINDIDTYIDTYLNRNEGKIYFYYNETKLMELTIKDSIGFLF